VDLLSRPDPYRSIKFTEYACLVHDFLCILGAFFLCSRPHLGGKGERLHEKSDQVSGQLALRITTATPAAAHGVDETVKIPGGVFRYVMSRLPAVLLNVVHLHTSQINNCAYCFDIHTRDLLRTGQNIEKSFLVRAWAEAGNRLDARERAALTWAETVTAETSVLDVAYVAARAVFEERELVDLTIAIGVTNSYNRMAIGFRNTPHAALSASSIG
jgi:AhpD family alkylhydroperoxidase